MPSDDQFASHSRRLSAKRPITLPDAQPDPIFDRFTRLAARVTGAQISVLSFVSEDSERLQLKSVHGTSELLEPMLTVPRGECLCEQVISRQQPVLVDDVTTTEQIRDCWLVHRTGLRAWFGVPISVAGNITVGSLSVAEMSPRSWTDDDVVALQDLATLIVEEIDRRQPGIPTTPEDALVEQRRRQTGLLLESIGEGIYAVGIDGVCRFINRAGANILGYEPHEMIGERLHELVHHSYPNGSPMPREECSLAQATKSGRAMAVSQHVYWRKDGNPVLVELTTSPVTDQGEVTGTVVRFNDLSERQLQQEQLRASEVRKSAMFESALDSIITIDHQGRVVEFNAAAERTFGYTREYAAGRLMADLIMPEEHRITCLSAFAEHLRTGESSVLGSRIERPAVRADGTRIEVEMAITRIDLPDQPYPIFTAYIRDITERKRAEQQILLYKHIVDSVGESVVASDMDRRIMYANRQAEQVLGWSIEDVRGKDIRDVIPAPEFRDRSDRIGAEVRATGKPLTEEFRLRRADGDVFPALVTLAPISGEDGELVGTIGIYRDITEIKQAENELRFHKHAIDAVGQALIANGLDRRITYWNDAAEEMLGWKAEEVLGKNFFDIAPAETLVDQVYEIGLRARQGKAWRGEFLFKHKDGHYIPTLSSVRPVTDAEGEIIGIIGAHSDLTEIKESERELRLYKHLTDAVGQALVANDVDRRITYWNAAAEEMLGWRAEEVLGRDFYEIVPADELLGEMQFIGKRLRQGHSWSGEFRLKRKSGEPFPVLMNVNPVLDDEGNIVQVIGAYTDISELKETEEEVRLYKHLTDAVGQALVANDVDRRITYWNKAAEDVFGWRQDEVLGEDFYRLTGTDESIHEMPVIGAQVRQGEAWSGEFQLRRKDGEAIPLLVNVSPVTDQAGNVMHVIGSYTDIREIRQREDDIRFFKHVVESIGEAVVATSLSGEITYVNTAAERMLGWTASELLGRTLVYTVPDQSRLEDAQELGRYVRTGSPWVGEFPLQRKDGSTFPALISLAPVINESGEATGIISVYSEISNLKRAEEENRFFKYVVDAVGQAVIANDLERKITYFNQAAEEILGWKAEEVIGVDAVTVAPAPQFFDEIPEIAGIVRTGGSWVGEFPLLHRDGSVIPAWTTLKPIYDQDGEIIGVLGAHTDIRELKQTEDELRFHKHIVDAVGQAVVVSDVAGHITYWNKAAEDIYGWAAEEALGELVFKLLPVDSDGGRASGITEWVAAGNHWAGEASVRTKDGVPFPAYFTVSPIRDTSGDIVGIIGVSHDISDQKDYERQIEFHKIMLDAVGQTIVTTDMNRVITYWSKGAEQALGWTAGEVVGRPIGDIAPAAHLKEEAGKLHRAVKAGNTWTGEFPIRRKDGSTFPAVVSLAPVNLAEQGTVGVIGVYTDVSELKQTEDQLRLHKDMLDAVGQAVCATDENLRVIYWNRAAEEQYGYSAAEAIGMKLLDFLPPGSRGLNQAVDAIEVVSREGGWTGEMFTYHKDGAEIAAIVNVSPILSDDERQVGLIVSMADISARRQIEKALQESNARVTEILETMGDGFVSLDRDWCITYVNRQAEVITGRSRDDLVGTDFWDQFPDPPEEPFYQTFLEAMETNQAVNVTDYDPFLNMWLEVRVSPLQDRLSVFFRDVTERRNREAALREAEERYRTLIEQIPAMTYVARPDDVSALTYVSPQVESMLGYSVEEWLENPSFWLELIHPDDYERVLKQDARTQTDGYQHFALEYRLRARDGSYRWLRDTARLIRDMDGNPSYWQGLSYDISEEKQAERQIQESEQRFRSLFHNHPDAVFSIDRVGRVLSANRAFEHMTGFTFDDGGTILFVDLVAQDDQERIQERFEETHEGYPQDFRAGLIDPAGDRIELNLTTIPIIVDDEIVGVHVVAQDVTVHQELENQLAHQAYHDSLTGLPNRNLFQNRLAERLEIARHFGDTFAVLFFDLDDFKVINDSLGHSAGDQLLIEVARRVQTCIRSDDLLARLGGDEFTLMLEHVTGEDEAIAIAERIAQVLDEAFSLDGNEVFATTSIGIAIGNAETSSSDDILRNADLAMYEAKNSGKNRYAVFEPSMNSRAWLRLTLETEIRRGIAREEFVVYYQPIIDLVTGDLHGVEALVRWNHPDRGFLNPGDFITVAEQSGLILPLGRWIIREASSQLNEWQHRMPNGTPLRLSLNLSPGQYQHPRLIEELTRTLQSVDFDPSLITLEITEKISMNDSPAAVETLRQLKEVGVQLALDDFGTGFSALSYLRRFPIDVIKIDKSFVAGLGVDEEDSNIVRAVMAASLAMNLQVTAEGIETVEQLEILRDLGCHYGQGYLFAHALTIDELRAIIEGGDYPWRSLIRDRSSA